MANAAGNLAQQPYTPFSGPQVAQPSDQTKQAWGLASSNVGNYQPWLTQAGALTQAAAAPITGEDIGQFVNPYEKYITQGMNTNLMKNVLPGISDRFVSSGQSRSPQEAMLTANAIGQNQQAVGQSMAGAYQGAVNSLLQERGQMGALGSQFGQLGALQQQLGSGDIANLAGAGQAQDTLSQANINAAMQNFYNQQNWPYQQLGFLSNMIHGIPLGAVGQYGQQGGQYYGSQPSGLQGLLGTAAYLGGGGGGNFGWKRGGAVRRGALSDLSMAA